MNSQLPVSREKIVSITGAAMRAAKFYKHVVQLVEQFIMRCPVETKVPGLYVVDAIVRESKINNHERDLYGPRFMRNITSIFSSLAESSPEERPMITCVLDLWRKANIFPIELINILEKIIYCPDNPNLLNSGMPLNLVRLASSSRDRGRFTRSI